MDESFFFVGFRATGQTSFGNERAEREPIYRETARLSADPDRTDRAEITAKIIEASRRRQGIGVV